MQELHQESNGVTVTVATPEVSFCARKAEYVQRFTEVIGRINEIHQGQLSAMLAGDLDFGRFDMLLHQARAEKEEIKYGWIGHAEAHGCGGL